MEIKKIDWNEFSGKYQTELSRQREINSFLTKIAGYLKTKKIHRTLYEVTIPYGEIFLQEGSFIFGQPTSYINTSEDEVTNDLKYSKDPLGLVLRNEVEVFSTNSVGIYGNKVARLSYRVKRNVLTTGEFFGVFGTLDYITDTYFEKASTSPKKPTWSAGAGPVTLQLAYPDFSDRNTQYQLKNIINNVHGNREIGEEIVSHFVKEFFKEKVTKAVLFPRHWFGLSNERQPLNDEAFIAFREYLFRLGWKQAEWILHSSFNDDIISQCVESAYDDNTRQTSDKTKKGKIKDVSKSADLPNMIKLYQYLVRAQIGELPVLKLVQDNDSELQEFKRALKNLLFTDPENGYVLLLKYETIKQNDSDDIGLFSFARPIFTEALDLPEHPSYWFKIVDSASRHQNTDISYKLNVKFYAYGANTANSSKLTFLMSKQEFNTETRIMVEHKGNPFFKGCALIRGKSPEKKTIPKS